MAIAATINKTTYHGDQKVTFGTIAFDSSYPTNGEAFTPSTFGLSSLDHLTVAPSGGYVFEPIISTSKIKAYWVDTTVDGAAMAEVANTTDLSAVTLAQFVAYGNSN